MFAEVGGVRIAVLSGRVHYYEGYGLDKEGLKEKGKEALEQGREFLAERRKELNEAIRAGREAMEREKEEIGRMIDPD